MEGSSGEVMLSRSTQESALLREFDRSDRWALLRIRGPLRDHWIESQVLTRLMVLCQTFVNLIAMNAALPAMAIGMRISAPIAPEPEVVSLFIAKTRVIFASRNCCKELRYD